VGQKSTKNNKNNTKSNHITVNTGSFFFCYTDHSNFNIQKASLRQLQFSGRW